ncbi:cell division topological specificity factor MinE [Candidatus Symbiobacter mobilis]|uniref:Cell division topological specificity factor n=1 Tax=Candidatus Symbiobacter mobilis CR TaxID=946483 RepID=U5N5K2_9BURK|nr:cell division topological specificity factor MinE [Candidatus Symbiobacter mobilis]AGX86540.1 hypothetical protein Cenrod_0420 [Candidatus Symbiobacter mobilis CR]
MNIETKESKSDLSTALLKWFWARNSDRQESSAKVASTRLRAVFKDQETWHSLLPELQHELTELIRKYYPPVDRDAVVISREVQGQLELIRLEVGISVTH